MKTLKLFEIDHFIVSNLKNKIHTFKTVKYQKNSKFLHFINFKLHFAITI